MRHAVKMGLVVGLVSLVLTFCISGFFGLISLVSPFLAGGIAGFFATGKALSKGQGASYGAISGAIAGGIVVHSDMIVRILLAFAEYSQWKSAYGSAISPFELPGDFLTMYILTVLPAISFGAITGAGAGFLGAKAQKPGVASADMIH